MKWLLIILLALFCYAFTSTNRVNNITTVKRDTVPTGAAPQLFGSKLYEFRNYALIDSFLMIMGGDTFAIPRWPGLKFKNSDNRWYGHDRTRWQQFVYKGDLARLNIDTLEWVSVTDYGAIPNDTLTDYTTNIQAAINTGARTVLFPTGIYIQTANLKLHSNQTLLGYGAKLLRKSASVGRMIINDSDGSIGGYGADSNMAVIGMHLDGNARNYPSAPTGGTLLIAFGHSKNITIKDCDITDTYNYHCVEVNACKDVLFDNVYFHDANTPVREMLQIDLMLGSGVFEAFGPYDLTPCENVIVQNCTFRNGVRGVGSHSLSNAFPHKNIIVKNCVFENLTETAIVTYNYSGFVADGNHFTNVSYAINEYSTNFSTPRYHGGYKVVNNTVKKLLRSDSDPQWQGIGFVFKTTNDITVDNNTIDSTNHKGIMFWNCDTVVVSHNTINHFGLQTNTEKYGIEINGTSNFKITDNTIKSLTNSDAIVIKTGFSTTPRNGFIEGNTIKRASTLGDYYQFSQFTPFQCTNLVIGKNLINDSIVPNSVSIASNYTAAGTEGVINANTSGGAVNITFNPTIVPIEGVTIVKQGSNTLTVTPSSGTINGQSSLNVGSITTIKSDGFNYQTLSGNSIIANNGISNDGDSTKLGQNVGQSGDPAILHMDRELPMNSFDVRFKDVGQNGTGILKLIKAPSKPMSTAFIQFRDQLDSLLVEFLADSINNIVIGRYAGRNLTCCGGNSGQNIFMGFKAGEVATTSSSNVGIGSFSLNRLTTGVENVGVGVSTMPFLTTGNGNIAFGYIAMREMSSGSNNIAMGGSGAAAVALSKNQTGSRNIALGLRTLAESGVSTSNFSGSIGIGINAMSNNSLGDKNISIGDSSCVNIPRGKANVFIGAHVVSNGGTSIGDTNIIISPYSTNIGGGFTNNNIVLGSNFHTTASLSNVTILGAGMTNNVNNVVRLGRDDQNVIIGATGNQSDNGARVQVSTTGLTGVKITMSNTNDGTHGAIFNRTSISSENAFGYTTNDVPEWFFGQNQLSSDFLIYTWLASKLAMLIDANNGDISFGNSLTALKIKNDGTSITAASLDTDNSPPTTSGTTKMVITDANAQLSFADIPSASTTIYTGDGTLASDRTVSTGGFATTWTGSNDNETTFSVVNTGTTNASAISGTASGTTSVGVSGTSGQYIGVVGTSTSNNGIQGQSTSGTGVVGVSSTGAAFRGQVNPASTNAIENVATLLRTTSAGAGANGLGAAIQYELETATSGTSQTAGSVAIKWTDATNATRTSQIEFHAVNSATTARKAAIAGTGQWTWDGYGAGTFTGTPTGTAQFDASGNVIEGPLVAAGTYTPTLTNTTNIAASTAYSCQYLRVGNSVTVSGKVDIDPTSTGATLLGISLPIASAFANDNENGGTASCGTSEGLQGSIKADATNDRATLDIVIAATGSTANNSWYFTFTYRII